MEKKSLEIGDKYLSISLNADVLLAKSLRAVLNGESKVIIPAFKYEGEESETAPKYTSSIVAVWLNDLKPDYCVWNNQTKKHRWLYRCQTGWKYFKGRRFNRRTSFNL